MYFSPRMTNLAFHHFCFISIYTHHAVYCCDYSFPLTSLVFSRNNDIFLYIQINKLTMQQTHDAKEV